MMYVSPGWGASPSPTALGARPQGFPARAPARQAVPATSSAQAPAPRTPVVRAQNPDESEAAPSAPAAAPVTSAPAYTPPPAPLTIPLPGEFGVAAAPERPAPGAGPAT